MSFESVTRVSGVIIAKAGPYDILATQYYDNLIPEKDRKAFEQELFEKIGEAESLEVVQLKQSITVFRKLRNFVIAVFGNLSCNELILEQIVNVFEAALDLIFQSPKFETMDGQIENIYMLLDEVIESGYVFCGDAEVVAARVLLRDDGAFTGKSAGFTPLQ